MERLPVRVVTAPTTEPVTLTEAKLDLRVTHTEEDALITSLIVAARKEAEQLSGRSFVTQTLEISTDEWPSNGRFYLPKPPLVSVTSIKYTGEDGVENTFSSDNYVVYASEEPGLIVLKSNASWPSTTLMNGPSIVIRYVAGYGAAAAVPDEYKRYIRALVAIDYESREGMTPEQVRQRDRIVSRLKTNWGW